MLTIAFLHDRGQPVPRLDYLPEEQHCWGLVLHELKQLYSSHACREFLQNLDRHNFRPDTVPQLEDVSQSLRSFFGSRSFVNVVSGQKNGCMLVHLDLRARASDIVSRLLINNSIQQTGGRNSFCTAGAG